MRKASDSLAFIAPFLTWMVLMFLLPSTPWSYGVRTLVTTGVLLGSAYRLQGEIRRAFRHFGLSLVWGLIVGLLVLFIWIWPEKTFAGYSRYCVFGHTVNAAVDTSAWTLKAVRLFGSAFIVSVAEELFFRRWLMRYAGFVWMVLLFAVEHDRWLAAAITGVLYGVLAMRKGLLSAILAHAITNLALGIYVLLTSDWAFW